MILRDQTKSVRRKAQRKKPGTQKLPSPPTSASSAEVPATTTWAVVNPGEGSSRAVARKTSSMDEGVPRMFNDFPEQQAVCAFFLDFVLLPRHPDSVQGHLEHLLPLYKQTSPDSPLSLATSSVALAFSGNSPVRKGDQQLGRSVFGRALRKTGAAIRNPLESRKDETLMAVLLLGLFEVRSMISSLPITMVSPSRPLPFQSTMFLIWSPRTCPRSIYQCTLQFPLIRSSDVPCLLQIRGLERSCLFLLTEYRKSLLPQAHRKIPWPKRITLELLL